MKGLAVGQSARLVRTFAAADVDTYRTLCGDKGLFFGTTTNEVPGPLFGGMISTLLGTTLPGRGTNWLKQRYTFPNPARLGVPITATVTIVRLRPHKHLVNLNAVCTDPRGIIVCTGETLVLVADLERENT
jgi:acyl dehydratase